MQEVHKFLTEVVFDANSTIELKEEDWWFEGETGTVMKWQVYRSSRCPNSNAG